VRQVLYHQWGATVVVVVVGEGMRITSRALVSISVAPPPIWWPPRPVCVPGTWPPPSSSLVSARRSLCTTCDGRADMHNDPRPISSLIILAKKRKKRAPFFSFRILHPAAMAGFQ
jgi:hypothetical protein